MSPPSSPLEPLTPIVPRPARSRLSLSSLIPPTNFLRRLSSPTLSTRRTSAPDEPAIRSARENAPSPASCLLRSSSSAADLSPSRPAVFASGRAAGLGSAIVEEPEHIEYCTEKASLRDTESSDGNGRGVGEGVFLRRSASETDTIAIPITAIPTRQHIGTTPSDGLYATPLHPQSAPTSPMPCQRVWLCSPPRRTPASPVSPFTSRGTHNNASPTHNPLSPFASPLDNIAAVAQHAKEQLKAAEAAEAASRGSCELGPLKRCRPVTTRAMSTGRLASEFDEDGRVICLSVHSDRVLAKGQRSSYTPSSGGRAYEGSGHGPTSWQQGGRQALSRTTSEKGALYEAGANKQEGCRRAARSSLNLQRPEMPVYKGAEGKRSRASFKGILGL